MKIAHTATLPDRNFRNGYPCNPATYTAESVDGEYYEGFVRDYSDKGEFEKDAERYFSRANNR